MKKIETPLPPSNGKSRTKEAAPAQPSARSMPPAPSPRTRAPSKRVPAKAASSKLAPSKTSSPKPASSKRILSKRARTGRPTAAEAELLSEHMFEAGWDLLLAHGFDGFSFDKLARKARVGKPTIYSRFTNKRAFLQALLQHRIEQRQMEITASAGEKPFKEVMPFLAIQILQTFLSPEGRLMDRLVDWLDHEGNAGEASVRLWAFETAFERAEDLMRAANSRGELRITDVPEAARFMLEGVIGHARVTDCAKPFDTDAQYRWATRFIGLMLDAFTAR